MTYEQYWYGHPLIAAEYIKAERFRQERMNAEAWLHGAYVARALASTVGNMFVKDKREAIEYPTEPIPLFKGEKKEEEPKQDTLKEEQEILFAKAYMEQLCRVGKDWGKKTEQGETNGGGND